MPCRHHPGLPRPRRSRNRRTRRPFQTIGGEGGSTLTSKLAPRRRSAIEHLARAIPRELGDKSGSVFYSGSTAFSEPGRHCIPGLNPGGDPVIQERETEEWRARKTLVGSRRYGRNTATRAGADIFATATAWIWRGIRSRPRLARARARYGSRGQGLRALAASWARAIPRRRGAGVGGGPISAGRVLAVAGYSGSLRPS